MGRDFWSVPKKKEWGRGGPLSGVIESNSRFSTIVSKHLSLANPANNAREDMSTTARKVTKDKDVHKGQIRYPFWFGGSASCFAATVTHPLDLGKF
jgi:hypothetical protein